MHISDSRRFFLSTLYSYNTNRPTNGCRTPGTVDYRIQIYLRTVYLFIIRTGVCQINKETAACTFCEIKKKATNKF